ncbi:B-cell receptor CD22-like isoform X2 [Trematomus bernacchii]|uniref:B-cell receptor CD22-like isoform X2 n=1 Tax=Trematomus bernacchii TaxID=40690 RepID=UPI00146E3F13|nr:B-cell receptor CD22-like isoform X2 [Trematomus bernacchii]
MAGALKVFLLLLQGSLCLTFEITMPLRIEGLTGSCVKVPCTFDFDSQYDVNLDDSCKAIWMRGSTAGTVVFDSSLTGDQASRNILQGNLTGNLQNKECTTIFYNMPPSHSDNYYFRIECNGLKYHFPTGVRITTQNSLDQPTITPSTLEVEEGALVTLSCTAVAPCPILPPGLTWTPRIGDIEEKHESESMVSVMNFTSSYLHNGQNFSCTAVYKRQAGNTDLRFEKFMTLHVLYPPKTTSVSYSATVKEGSLVNLTCNGNANPAVYTWYKVNGGQVTDVGSGKRFSTTVSEVDRHFYCKVSNRYGTQNSSITQIDVQFPPKETAIIIEPKGPLLEGSSVSLLCKSRANPPVTNYTWYKGDEEEKEAGSSLVLNDVKPSSSGDYYCVAENEHGDQNSTLIRLDIQFPPKETAIIIEPKGPLLEGSSVSLLCKSQANPPVTNYTWYKGDEEEKEAGSSLVLNYVKPSSSGDYYCVAENEHGDQNSTLIRLDIQYPPKNTSVSYSATVKEGSLVNLTCNGNANPAVYTWYKVNGGQVTDVGLGKRFSTTVSEVDRQFYCKVSNRYGTQNSSITQIDVQFPPKETTIIIEPKGPLLEGSSVSLLCKSRANPPVTNYTWYKVDEAEMEAGSSLVLNNVKPSSSGDYYCVAENEHGDQNSTLIRLDIQYPPTNTSVSYSATAKEGSLVNLTCNGNANPAVYTWYKVNGGQVTDVGSGKRFSITVSEVDRHFYCKVSNRYGTQNSSITQIDVQYLPKNTSVSVDPSGPVQDGSSVTLTCTSIANPAAVNFTWFRAAGIEEKVMGSERDLTFNVTKLSEDQYYCEALNVHGPGTSEHVSFDVTFPPEILSSSRCIKISSMIRCSCYSQGNPPPSLVWKLAGEPVNHSAAITIREESLGNVGMKSIITLYDLDEDTLSLVCLSINSLGFDSFAFNMSLSKGLHLLSFGIGFVVAALGMLLVGVPLLIIYYRRGKVISSSDKGKAETCNPVVTDVINSSKVDVIYANKAFLEEKDVAEEEPLHYVNVYFAKLQAHSKGKPGEEIRGLDSKTEYAEIRLQSRGNIGGDAEEEENVSDTQLEQEKTP